MRIAILSPITRPTAVEQYGSSEDIVARLAEGLIERGLDVTLFDAQPLKTNGATVGDGPLGHEKDKCLLTKIRECLHISEVFERGDEFDLIHNHFDFLPLTYLRMTTTPVLSTVHGHLPPEALSVYKKYNGMCHYVATSEAGKNPELDYMATIHLGVDVDRMVNDYIQVYERILEQRKREDHRPWGFYEILSDRADHKVKRITVYPNQRLSLQRHQKRAEHWYVIQGEAVVDLDDGQVHLQAGEAVDIQKNSWHRVRNPGKENMAFIEVQTGEYFGEDDIERKEDDYGRT